MGTAMNGICMPSSCNAGFTPSVHVANDQTYCEEPDIPAQGWDNPIRHKGRALGLC